MMNIDAPRKKGFNPMNCQLKFMDSYEKQYISIGLNTKIRRF